MKISQNVKQDTSSKKNSSQTVEIGNKTNERKQCQKQKIFNNKLERSDQKANTNTSAEMKISQNVKQDTSSEKNSPQTVEIGNKTNETKQCQKQNIFNNKIERSDQKAKYFSRNENKMWNENTSNKILLLQKIVHKQYQNKTNERKAMSKTKHI